MNKLQEQKLKRLLKPIVEFILREEMYNKKFLVTFISLDGNEQEVYVDAPDERQCKREIERSYEYDEILSIEEIDDDE